MNIKDKLLNIQKEAEISKLAQELMETTQDGQEIADKIFDKLLEDIVSEIDKINS